MAFNFGQSTPAFGAASSASLFGAAQTPAFGAAPASTPSLFGGGASPSPFGGAVSTPAFSFAQSSASLFGASSAPAAFGAAAATPSLFGGATPAFQSSSQPSLFGSPSPSLFGATTSPSLFGQQPQPQQQLQQEQQLVTKDNHPVTHSTKWDDLSPQAQKYLTDLQQLITKYRDECQQLQGEERLQQEAAAREGFEEATQSLARGIAAIKTVVKADMSDANTVRTDVMHLLRHTEAVLSSFKRAHAWREASKATTGQPLPGHILEQLGGPVALPSPFLSAAIQELSEKAAVQRAAAADLETALQRSSHNTSSNTSNNGGSSVQIAGGDAASSLHSLQSAITNLHDCLVHAAAQLQSLDEKVAKVKEVYIDRQRQAGNYEDPFEAVAREERSSKEVKKQVGGKDGGGGGQWSQQHGQGGAHPAASPGQTPAHSPPVSIGAAGLFGTVSPAPTGFGTPLTGFTTATTSTGQRRKGRR